MFRRLINLLATISLILAFAAIVFWIRSYQHEEAVCYGHPDDQDFSMLMSSRGMLSLERIEMPERLAVDYQRGLWAYSSEERPNGSINHYAAGSDVSSTLGVVTARGHRPLAVPRPEHKRTFTTAPARGWAVPYWTPTGLLLLLPIGRMASAVQSRRRDRQGATEPEEDVPSP